MQLIKPTISLVLVILATIAAAQAQPQMLRSELPIKDARGAPVANHRVDPAAEAQLEKLPGAVIVGNPAGDVTLVQFYDLNCPYCRAASRDIDVIVRDDPKLRLIFVPYPILSAASIEAGRVELGVAKLAPPEKFFEFHRKIYAGRGLIDGARALAAAAELGLDQKALVEIANDDDTTDKLKTHARLAMAMKLLATPSYVIKGTAIVGHPGLVPLQGVIASARKCGKVVC
jgi:protein-disulfide isomerase